MAKGLVGRSTELESIARFFSAAGAQPTGLLLEGEAGIGKTSLWQASLEQAHGLGRHVLSARVWEAESVLAYGTVADLLADVDADALQSLPDVQRVAVDRVLSHSASAGPETDQHVLAAALLSIIETLAADAPVVVGIDDLQWLDPSSRAVVSFVARRLRGPVGLIATERTEPDRESSLSWLQLTRPDALSRVRVSPMSLGSLHEVLNVRLGRSFSRPVMVRIADLSAGNPLYALEMARAMDAGPDFPRTLADLVQMRISDLGDDVQRVLLAAACVAEPTVDVLALATGSTAERTAAALEDAETRGVVEIVGNRVRFAHPLLARGVYVGASSARRRRMHRALSKVVEQPELKARHLALASSRTDPEILQALDAAADAARGRGAPAAAAELLDLAIKLGGDSPSRRLRSAGHHFRAGDTDQAYAMLAPLMPDLRPGTLRALALNLLAGIWIYRRSFNAAADALKDAVKDAQENTAVLTQTLLMLSFAQANAGEYAEALRNAEQAVSYADELGIPVLTSQALADWQVLSALCGHGFDEAEVQRALDLEDPDFDVPIPFRAHSAAAQVFSWAGRLDEAYEHMQVLRRRCMDRGADSDMLFVAVWRSLINVWRADFAEGAETADDAMERAEQMGGDHGLVIALTVRGLVAAYTGRVEQARADATAAIEAAHRFEAPLLAEWPIMTLGFVSASLGEHQQVLADLKPLLLSFDNLTCTEIIKAAFVPDAVEAMVALGRLEEAEPMIETLHRNGSRLDRPWMLAMAARCRAMVLAAQGDVEAAERSARQAMAEHDRMAMPFERARTQLLLGALQRRQRQKHFATATFTEALHTFEDVGAPIWAERARAEILRTNVAPKRGPQLTPSEQRVAELAASGLTNRDVAAKLFVSTKTVEANLSQVYRKLGIRSRAELGRVMGQ
ncbi:helix-turn-helix transcriptional regulator [Mycobacterium deserti]|uniref:AAA family ATPase n=1 Tax=Mycobacterium deserti TaxID=2978347 RepID=A0ABT2MAE7_9MYCO|nr:AAA family ATPase [Mycobacterium deserti]MCT7658886.1 AAA family ATPase [Mycobacterium deserti]